jgi:cell division protein ZapA
MKETLIQLNIADDYFKARSQVEKLEKEIESKDKEIYDLKHDLISNQVKTESAEEALKKVREENRELLLNKARLESALEEKLLDTDKDKDKEKEKTASSSRKK